MKFGYINCYLKRDGYYIHNVREVVYKNYRINALLDRVSICTNDGIKKRYAIRCKKLYNKLRKMFDLRMKL